ncbi:unnamed protein product [Choristocarpus tenellus]
MALDSLSKKLPMLFAFKKLYFADLEEQVVTTGAHTIIGTILNLSNPNPKDLLALYSEYRISPRMNLDGHVKDENDSLTLLHAELRQILLIGSLGRRELKVKTPSPLTVELTVES